MTFLILSTSIMVFTIIITIFYNVAIRSDNKKRRLNMIIGNYRIDYDDDLEKPFLQRFLFPIFMDTVKGLSNILPKNKSKSKNNVDKNIKMAGLNMSANEFGAAKLMFSCGLTLAAMIITMFIPMNFQIKLLIVLFSFIISLIVPIYFLKFKISSRQEEIRKQLPNVLDLLSVSMEAGLGFDAALIKIGERLDGPLVDELNMVLTEIQLGKSRREALRILAERSTVEELKTFVSSIVQADQLGIPIKNILHTQAQQLRKLRKQKAQEKGMKAPVKMMLPLVVFIFPVLFIILLGPTILQLVKQFAK
ncbi:MAG: type II secretion system F family protein [Bacillota bacterium]|nr:type II secretion system F family protein [Bacillota bacterium]